ncbi:MAG TPA: hypothetical protein VMT43_08525 [Acidimicrobiales bacterium]|nr:hypothetical protein [Acidimicrobiales bacterium]
MDHDQTQAAATRLAAKLEALDLDDDERSVLVAILGAGAASVESDDEVAGFAVDAFIWFTPPDARSNVAADESPKETVTFEYGGLVVNYQRQ